MLYTGRQRISSLVEAAGEPSIDQVQQARHTEHPQDPIPAMHHPEARRDGSERGGDLFWRGEGRRGGGDMWLATQRVKRFEGLAYLNCWIDKSSAPSHAGD